MTINDILFVCKCDNEKSTENFNLAYKGADFQLSSYFLLFLTKYKQSLQ